MHPVALLLVVLAVALGAAVGAVARLLVTEWFTARCGTGFPWGTLVVNASGALLIGLLAGAWGVPAPGALDRFVWLAAVVGLLGSYTTVSSFALQVLMLADDRRYRLAAWYVGASVLGCLVLVVLGFAAGRAFGGAA